MHCMNDIVHIAMNTSRNSICSQEDFINGGRQTVNK